jgi:hypothetical protein
MHEAGVYLTTIKASWDRAVPRLRKELACADLEAWLWEEAFNLMLR